MEGTARRARVLLKGLLAVFVGVPLLLVAILTYTSFSPHLLVDPISRAIYQAHENIHSKPITLAPGFLDVGAEYEAIEARMERAGFRLETRSFKGTDETRDGEVWFARSGRSNIACGETLVVQLAFEEGRLTTALGHSSWTCL